jgi:hypothetical protein
MSAVSCTSLCTDDAVGGRLTGLLDEFVASEQRYQEGLATLWDTYCQAAVTSGVANTDAGRAACAAVLELRACHDCLRQIIVPSFLSNDTDTASAPPLPETNAEGPALSKGELSLHRAQEVARGLAKTASSMLRAYVKYVAECDTLRAMLSVAATDSREKRTSFEPSASRASNIQRSQPQEEGPTPRARQSFDRSLPSLLIAPLQRMVQYRVLLQQMCAEVAAPNPSPSSGSNRGTTGSPQGSQSPQDSDGPPSGVSEGSLDGDSATEARRVAHALHGALATVSAVCRAVDAEKDTAENARRLGEVAVALRAPALAQRPGRRFLNEEQVTRLKEGVPRPCQLYLFSDVLVVRKLDRRPLFGPDHKEVPLTAITEVRYVQGRVAPGPRVRVTLRPRDAAIGGGVLEFQHETPRVMRDWANQLGLAVDHCTFHA